MADDTTNMNILKSKPDKMNALKIIEEYGKLSGLKHNNINWRDVQTKNVVNNVDMSNLRAPWQNDPYKN